MQVIRVVDVENTGEREGAAVIELGICDVIDGIVDDPIAFLVDPKRPILPEASGVHHLVNADVDGSDELDGVASDVLLQEPKTPYFAAHNAETEVEALGRFVPEALWICTWKCAMRAWPEAPDFRLQTLRYWLGIGQDPKARPAHRAGPDAYVTARVVALLLGKVPLEQLLIWTQEDPHWPRVPFGQHYGKLWSDVDESYLDWMLRSDLDAQKKAAAKRELGKRKAAKAAAYVERCLGEIAGIEAIDRLEAWFRMQANDRAKHEIVEGSAAWHRIVEACAVRKAAITPPGAEQGMTAARENAEHSPAGPEQRTGEASPEHPLADGNRSSEPVPSTPGGA